MTIKNGVIRAVKKTGTPSGSVRPTTELPLATGTGRIINGRELFKNPKGTSFSRGNKTYPVGKVMGNQVYFHKDYIGDMPKRVQDLYKKALDDLPEGFEFNTLMYESAKKGKPARIRLDEAADFDLAREPTPGKLWSYWSDGNTRTSESKNVWHHKWQWVGEDYKGFNIDTSYDWSKQWTQALNKSPQSSPEKWRLQLIENKLPLASKAETEVSVKRVWIEEHIEKLALLYLPGAAYFTSREKEKALDSISEMPLKEKLEIISDEPIKEDLERLLQATEEIEEPPAPEEEKEREGYQEGSLVEDPFSAGEDLERLQATRATRNNNPYNLVYGPAIGASDIPWNDKLPHDPEIEDTFERFLTPLAGMRAGLINTLTHYERGKNTVRDLISGHAPQRGDIKEFQGKDENPTESFIRYVADEMGVEDTDELDLTNRDTLRKYNNAVIKFEGFENTDETLADSAIDLAYEYKQIN